MKVSDILSLEAKNEDSINLLKEGIFWRSYNRSAMRLRDCLQSYKVNVKYIKKVQQKIYYCGFPDTFLAQITQKANDKGCQINQINERHIAIKNIPGDTVAYDEWKNKYHNENDALMVNEPPVQYKGNKDRAVIFKKIREFPLENSTPMQTMLFVQELKQMLH